MNCWYCDRSDQSLTLKVCCNKHPNKMVCADVEGCRDFLLAQVRKHDDALVEPWDEAAEANHERQQPNVLDEIEGLGAQTELWGMLRAIREAVSIPHAATEGDAKVHDKILLLRVLQVQVTLDGIFEDLQKCRRLDVPWSTSYLREQLAKHPAEGYRLYSELVADPKEFYAGLAAEREVIRAAGGQDG